MWTSVERPGFFGRRKDEKRAELDQKYGYKMWRLAWQVGEYTETFFNACRKLYEESYYQHFLLNQQDLDHITSYGECIDNAPTNVESGLDYMKQEAYSTHIQDIAIRNCLRRFDRWFTGTSDRILVIRSKDSEGYRFGPGNIRFFRPELIVQPSLVPKWANPGSVEDFWQSNKWVQVWRP